jgi:hypothetical protein
LFPKKIIRDLGLNLELRRRATGSFTPDLQNGQPNVESLGQEGARFFSVLVLVSN